MNKCLIYWALQSIQSTSNIFSSSLENILQTHLYDQNKMLCMLHYIV